MKRFSNIPAALGDMLPQFTYYCTPSFLRENNEHRKQNDKVESEKGVTGGM